MLAHSFRLNNFLVLKRKLWRHFLATARVQFNEDFVVDQFLWMVKNESFPVLRLKLDHGKPTSPAEMDVIVQFLTTPAEYGIDQGFVQQCAPSWRRVGFAFNERYSNINMTP